MVDIRIIGVQYLERKMSNLVDLSFIPKNYIHFHVLCDDNEYNVAEDLLLIKLPGEVYIDVGWIDSQYTFAIVYDNNWDEDIVKYARFDNIDEVIEVLKEIFVKDKTKIPNGQYCYDGIFEYEGGQNFIIKTPCPYWLSVPSKDKQECGYCLYLESGDWNVIGLSLLWDQVKECGENK